jgi:hypothetical protein
MRELFRTLLSANLLFTGIVLTLAALLTFFGTIYLINYTNVGKRLGVLILGAGTFGWTTINSVLFVLYAPRGPRPVDFEGLNAFEIRIIPGAFTLGSAILFAMFLAGMSRYEADQERAE